MKKLNAVEKLLLIVVGIMILGLVRIADRALVGEVIDQVGDLAWLIHIVLTIGTGFILGALTVLVNLNSKQADKSPK